MQSSVLNETKGPSEGSWTGQPEAPLFTRRLVGQSVVGTAPGVTGSGLMPSRWHSLPNAPVPIAGLRPRPKGGITPTERTEMSARQVADAEEGNTARQGRYDAEPLPNTVMVAQCPF